MIIARLRGGLGNQLFQYAAAKALALHHGTSLKLDLYTYTKHPYRKFELHNFKVDAPEASRNEVHRFTGSNKLIRYINKRENYFRCSHVFAQPHYHYYEDFLQLPSDLYLSGYFQTEKYFLSLRDQVLEWFSPRMELDVRNSELLQSIKSVNSVSIHVRKGDYNAIGYDQFYGGLPASYYEKAIELIREHTAQPEFFIFSDDIEWCRKNLNVGQAVFVDHNPGADSWKDLVLMSACQHNVIANSSFSWWGAWLNANDAKKVIAPAQWFQKSYSEKKEPVYPCRYYNTRDIIPQGWITLA